MSRLCEALFGWWLLDPWMLLLVLLLPLYLLCRRRRGAPAVPFAPAALLAGLPPSPRARLLWLPPVLRWAALLLLILALARPVVRLPLPLSTPGIDILLLLDTSSSMAAKDMDPERTRLQVARAAAARFVAGRPRDRIGLLRFARYPDLLCPLTLDHAALRVILDAVGQVEREGPEDVTGIGTVCAAAARLLERGTTPSKVVILFTDGEENVATAQTPDEIGPARAGALCAALGVKVYAIAAGVGKRGPDGRQVPLDTGQIEKLALNSGGRFYHAPDAKALAGVYAQIDGLERVEQAEPRYKVEERFFPLLIAVLLLLFCGRLLSATVLEVRP